MLGLSCRPPLPQSSSFSSSTSLHASGIIRLVLSITTFSITRSLTKGRGRERRRGRGRFVAEETEVACSKMPFVLENPDVSRGVALKERRVRFFSSFNGPSSNLLIRVRRRRRNCIRSNPEGGHGASASAFFQPLIESPSAPPALRSLRESCPSCPVCAIK